MVGKRSRIRFSSRSLFWVATIACLLTVIYVQLSENNRLRMQARSRDELAALRTPIDVQVNSERLVETDRLAVLSIKVATTSAHEILLDGRVIAESIFDLPSNNEISRTFLVAWTSDDGRANMTISCDEFNELRSIQKATNQSLHDLLPEYALGGIYSDGKGMQPETLISLNSGMQLTLSFRRRFDSK